MTAGDSSSHKLIHADRTACAVILLLVLGLIVAAVILARAASPFVASLLVTATPEPTPTLAAAKSPREGLGNVGAAPLWNESDRQILCREGSPKHGSSQAHRGRRAGSFPTPQPE